MKVRFPLIATIIVVLAVATMIGLGIWQLQRKGEKEALLASYRAASAQPAIAYPVVPDPEHLPLYRKSSIVCLEVVGWKAVSGKNANGKAGLAHLAECRTGGAEGPGARIAIGWSERPMRPDWTGGSVAGVIAPDGERLIRLVATKAPDGLQPLAPPSLADIPNNHLLYAIQWFFFAAAAAVIYLLALRKRQTKI